MLYLLRLDDTKILIISFTLSSKKVASILCYLIVYGVRVWTLIQKCERESRRLLLLFLLTADRTEVVKVLGQLDPVDDPVQLKLRGKELATGLTRLHLQGPLPSDNGSFIAVFFHLDAVCRTDIHARSAGDTCERIPKRRGHLPLITPADESDSMSADDLPAYPLTESTEYAIIGFFYHTEPGSLNSHIFGHRTDILRLGGSGQEQFQNHAAGTLNVFGRSGDLYTGIHRIVAGGSHPCAASLGHLHQAEAARPIRGNGLVIAKVGNLETMLKGYREQHRSLLSLHLKTIDLKCDEFLLRHHSTFTASTGHTS